MSDNRLVGVFRGPESEWGEKGDRLGWSTEETAVRLIEHLRARVDEFKREVERREEIIACADHLKAELQRDLDRVRSNHGQTSAKNRRMRRDMLALERELRQAERVINGLEKENARLRPLREFKGYVHQRFDEAGIPTHPDGQHSRAGCRVGDRFDLLVGQVETLKELVRESLAMAGRPCLDYSGRRDLCSHPICAWIVRARAMPLVAQLPGKEGANG